MNHSEFEKVQQAAAYVRRVCRAAEGALAGIAVVLGSGLSPVAEALLQGNEKETAAGIASIPFSSIPHFPAATAEGHAGLLLRGRLRGQGAPVLIMAGRVHGYEGYQAREVAFPVRVLAALGVGTVILTNAAGGMHPEWGQGALVLVRDHINFLPNPLAGPNDERFGPRFPDLSAAYDAGLRKLAGEQAEGLGLRLHEGVYIAVPGPSYETPAEIRAFRMLGADLVGMSTVPEVLAARHLGLRVLAISVVTNLAAGLSAGTINHEEVLATGRRMAGQLEALLGHVIAAATAEK